MKPNKALGIAEVMTWIRRSLAVAASVVAIWTILLHQLQGAWAWLGALAPLGMFAWERWMLEGLLRRTPNHVELTVFGGLGAVCSVLFLVLCVVAYSRGG
jgi:hypothetical protein